MRLLKAIFFSIPEASIWFESIKSLKYQGSLRKKVEQYSVDYFLYRGLWKRVIVVPTARARHKFNREEGGWRGVGEGELSG